MPFIIDVIDACPPFAGNIAIVRYGDDTGIHISITTESGCFKNGNLTYASQCQVTDDQAKGLKPFTVAQDHREIRSNAIRPDMVRI